MVSFGGLSVSRVRPRAIAEDDHDQPRSRCSSTVVLEWGPGSIQHAVFMRLCEAENTKIFFFPPRAVRACRSINRVRSHRLDPSAMKQSSVCVCVTRLTSAQREANHARAWQTETIRS